MIILDWGAIILRVVIGNTSVGKFWRGPDILDLELPKALHWLELPKMQTATRSLLEFILYGKEKERLGICC